MKELDLLEIVLFLLDAAVQYAVDHLSDGLLLLGPAVCSAVAI